MKKSYDCSSIMIYRKEVSILLKRDAGRRSAPNRQRRADHVVVALAAELRRHTDQPRAAGLDRRVPGPPPRAAVLVLPGSPVARPRAPIGTCTPAPDRTPLPIARRWPTGSPSPSSAPSPSSTPDTRRPGGGGVPSCAGPAPDRSWPRAAIGGTVAAPSGPALDSGISTGLPPPSQTRAPGPPRSPGSRWWRPVTARRSSRGPGSRPPHRRIRCRPRGGFVRSGTWAAAPIETDRTRYGWLSVILYAAVRAAG
jgi:translation initiation factor IF-2